MVAQPAPEPCHRCHGPVFGTRWVLIKNFGEVLGRPVCDSCAEEIDAAYRAWKARGGGWKPMEHKAGMAAAMTIAEREMANG